MSFRTVLRAKKGRFQAFFFWFSQNCAENEIFFAYFFEIIWMRCFKHQDPGTTQKIVLPTHSLWKILYVTRAEIRRRRSRINNVLEIVAAVGRNDFWHFFSTRAKGPISARVR